MKPAQAGAYRTGRASKVREYLAKQRKPKTARQILDAVEPDGCITLMCATLATMTRSGYVLRDGSEQGNVRYLFGKAKPRRDNSRTEAPVVTASKHVRTALPAKAIAKPSAKRILGTVLTPTRVTAREQKANFTAPLSTVQSVRRLKSNHGHETVEAFLRRGGRIQKLGLGASSQPLNNDYDRHREQRAKGRATQKRIRAIQTT